MCILIRCEICNRSKPLAAWDKKGERWQRSWRSGRMGWFFGGNKMQGTLVWASRFRHPPSLPLLVTARRVVVWDCHVVTTMCLVVTRGRFRLCAFPAGPVRNGHIKRITDPDIQSSVLEIAGTNVSTTYVTCPADPKQTLGIKLPFLVMIIKNVRVGELCVRSLSGSLSPDPLAGPRSFAYCRLPATSCPLVFTVVRCAVLPRYS